MAKDPVCGMTVDEKKAAATASYQSQTHYFCSAACKVMFEKTPTKYIGARG
jgi:YHS domain-containing protein